MDIYMNVDDLANHLGVSSSTVKKYYLLIEERGYKFRRNIQGNLAFTQDDLELFKIIFKLKSEPKSTVNGSIDKALGVITDTTDITDEVNVSHETNSSEDITDMTVITNMGETLNELKSYIEKQDRTLNEQNRLIKEQSRMIYELNRSNRENKQLLENKDEKSLLENNLEEMNEIKDMLKEVKENSEKPWWKFW